MEATQKELSKNNKQSSQRNNNLSEDTPQGRHVPLMRPLEINELFHPFNFLFEKIVGDFKDIGKDR